MQHIALNLTVLCNVQCYVLELATAALHAVCGPHHCWLQDGMSNIFSNIPCVVLLLHFACTLFKMYDNIIRKLTYNIHNSDVQVVHVFSD